MAKEIWCAGDLEVDAGLHRVLKGGEPIELPRLSLDLLLALFRSAPHFVSNEELMQQVWKGLVVSPETVTQRVKLLRDALGDDPRQPRYIEGLRSRGYRLIPTVHGPEGSTQTAGIPETAQPRSPRWALTLIAAGIVLLAGSAWWLHQSNAPPPAPEPVTAEDRTVAILPFRVSEPLADGESLALGLTDSVLSQLSGISGLTVIARNSAFQLDSRKLGPEETGRKLGARYLVDGLIQQRDDTMRVTVQLQDSHSGIQLWARQYERQVGDFFGMQDAVAAGVAHALESRIAGLDPRIPAGPRSENLEAYLAYLRGRALLGRTTIVGSEAAAQEFQHALSLDSKFAPAVVGLYDSRLQAASLRRTGMPQAIAANAALLEKAEALQPVSGAALLARAMWSAEKPEVRADYFEQGLKLDPANVRAMTAYSEMLDNMGRIEEGKQWLDRAVRIDPLWPRARFRLAMRNFDAVGAAIEQQNLRTLELDPNYYPALQRQSKYLWQQHASLPQAIAVIERAITTDPENPWGRHLAAALYLDMNEPQSAEDVVRGNEVSDNSTRALRAMYRGDWRAAGEAALADGSYRFNVFERWGVSAALRDYALRGQRTDGIMRTLAQRHRLPNGERWHLEVENFREAQLLAHLMMKQGRHDEAVAHLDEVIAWIDANAYMGPVYNLRTKAQALALKGNRDAALELLAESFRQNDYTHWWYTLEYDPTWNDLRTDSRFVKIAALVRTHVADQARQMAQQRSEGLVLDRRSAGAVVYGSQ
jgi:TolB-like protein/DNA-binding winged helix-turn-helix (wHTH) protein/Tfp pilus assembly protein PilF